ncbi:hypothetical protein HID58_067376, partial [Brassica napus]
AYQISATCGVVENRKPFKFFNFLTEHEVPLREINMNNFGNIRNRTKEAFEELCQHQTQVLLNPTSASYFAEAEASTRMQRLTLIEEKFVMQKSRIRWFTVGNQNTTFYHNVVLERSARNIIQILHTADGVPLLATEDIKHEAVNYFQKFLQADPTSSATSSYDELRDLL